MKAEVAEAPITNKDGSRFYPRKGNRYVSVTTVIGDVLRDKSLEQWRGHVGNREANARRDAGGDLGNRVHQACRMIATGSLTIPMTLEPEQQAKADAFERWMNLAVVEVLDIERTVYNDRYQYAGTLDLRLLLKGDSKRPTIADIKSGQVHRDKCRLQTAAYKEADGVLAYRRIIIDLGTLTKDGLPRIHEYNNHDSDYMAFLHTLSLYRWRRQGEPL